MTSESHGHSRMSCSSILAWLSTCGPVPRSPTVQEAAASSSSTGSADHRSTGATREEHVGQPGVCEIQQRLNSQCEFMGFVIPVADSIGLAGLIASAISRQQQGTQAPGQGAVGGTTITTSTTSTTSTTTTTSTTIAAQGSDEQQQEASQTSMILRHAPKPWDTGCFLKLLVSLGFDEKINFVFVPRNKSRSHGIGIVNFKDAKDAAAFKTWADQADWHAPGRGQMTVVAASEQGFDVHVRKAISHQESIEGCCPRVFTPLHPRGVALRWTTAQHDPTIWRAARDDVEQANNIPIRWNPNIPWQDDSR